jgi:hypothetical protein
LLALPDVAVKPRHVLKLGGLALVP